MAEQAIKSIIPIWQAIEEYKDKVGIRYDSNAPLSSGFNYYIVNPLSRKPEVTIRHKDTLNNDNSILLGNELPSQILLEAIKIDYNLFRRHFSAIEELEQSTERPED